MSNEVLFMNNKSNSNLSVDFLRKQRDGLIIGEYRNILYNTYQAIYKASKQNRFLLSDIPELQNGCFVPFGVVLSYCNDLEKLGYIRIIKKNNDYEIIIIKNIDF